MELLVCMAPTTWSSVAAASTTWTALAEPANEYVTGEGSPIGLLLALTYPGDITTVSGWTDVASPSTTWTSVASGT